MFNTHAHQLTESGIEQRGAQCRAGSREERYEEWRGSLLQGGEEREVRTARRGEVGENREERGGR